MELWYERLELAEERQKEIQRDVHNWELLREALNAKGTLVHPAAQLFNQINQRTKQIRSDELAQSAKDEHHVDQLA
jgi:hypothetical protein